MPQHDKRKKKQTTFYQDYLGILEIVSRFFKLVKINVTQVNNIFGLVLSHKRCKRILKLFFKLNLLHLTLHIIVYVYKECFILGCKIRFLIWFSVLDFDYCVDCLIMN
jgi:hypothetical protein